MTHDQLSHDDRIFEEVMRPDISALANTVISLLGDKTDEASRTVRASILRTLVTECLRPSNYDAEMLLSGLQENRLLPDDLVDVYIPEAARILGTMWIEDDISFAQVTIASARLQGLLALLAPQWNADPVGGNAPISVLLVLQAGAHHTLGAHVAAAQLRRLGAHVHLLFGADCERIERVVSSEEYDLIMFSCTNTDALETISQCVKRVRAVLATAPPIAVGGLILTLSDRIKERTQADLVTSDVKVAFRICDRKRSKAKIVAK